MHDLSFLSKIRKKMNPPLSTWGSCTDWVEFAVLMHISRWHLGTNFCDLSDVKCQRDLLCDAALIADSPLKKVSVSEVVSEGMQAVKEPGSSSTMTSATTVGRSTTMVYY